MLVQREGALRQTSYTAQLEIWSAEEFEYVESILTTDELKPGNVPDLMREKLIGQYVDLPMSTFLADKYSGSFPSNHYIHVKREEMFQIILQTLSLKK